MPVWSGRSVRRIRASAVAEFLRSWRVEGNGYAIAQTLRPRFGVDALIKEHWTLSASGAWSSGRSFHAYDNISTNIMVTYTRERNSESQHRPGNSHYGYPLTIFFWLGTANFLRLSGERAHPNDSGGPSHFLTYSGCSKPSDAANFL